MRIVLQGNLQRPPNRQESDCPTPKRNYFSYGTLPAAAGDASAYVNVEAQGLSRGQVGAVLRSLRAVG